MATKLIIFTHRPEDLNFAKKIAEKLKIELVQFNGTTPIEPLLADRKGILFIDVDHPRSIDRLSPACIHYAMDKVQHFLTPGQVFALADRPIFELNAMSRSPSFGHYFVRNYDQFSLEWVPKLIAHIEEKDPFSIDVYKEKDCKDSRMLITASKQKLPFLEGLRNVVIGKKVPERCADVVIQAVDELIMNAIFDAPVDEKGRTYRKSVERDEFFNLSKKEEVEVNIILNPQSIVIAVKDNFGSFSAKAALNLIQKDYSKTEYQADAHVQSAGLGLRGIVGSGMGMLMNMRNGVGTQAVITFPLFKNFKSMRNSFRSFSLNRS